MNELKRRRQAKYVVRPAAMAVMALMASFSHAGEIEVDNPDVKVRWDNTFKYSWASRLKSPSATLLSNPNNDDGDRNFNKGTISSRVDLFSEMDITYKGTSGLRLSAAAWSDSVYNGANDNPGFPGGATPNNMSVAANQFTDETRKVHGRKAEVLDAFVFTKFDLEGGKQGSIRAGQHSLLWGESLFFGGNAIAGGQQPVDVVKLVSVPNTQFKEAILPVPQISGQIQLSPTMSMGAYYQTDWKKSRVPAVGSYFSNADPAPAGGESILLGAGFPPPALRTADLTPKKSGQGGLQLKLRGEDADYGFYVTRFHAKTPQVVASLADLSSLIALPPGTVIAPGSYTQVYHQGIKALGASASKTFGDFNVAIEGSIHSNQDLASSQGANASALAPPGIIPATNNTSNPGYAVGRTAHINISTLGVLGQTFLWREANLMGEIAWNRVLKVTKNAAALDPNGTRDGVAVRVVLEPMYRNVIDGVDIGVPIGLGYAPKGSRPLAVNNPNSWIPEDGGDFTIGLNASYRDAWRFTLSYTKYFGHEGTFNTGANNAYSWKQTLKDRDFIAASLRYSF